MGVYEKPCGHGLLKESTVHSPQLTAYQFTVDCLQSTVCETMECRLLTFYEMLTSQMFSPPTNTKAINWRSLLIWNIESPTHKCSKLPKGSIFPKPTKVMKVLWSGYLLVPYRYATLNNRVAYLSERYLYRAKSTLKSFFSSLPAWPGTPFHWGLAHTPATLVRYRMRESLPIFHRQR